MEKSFTDYLSFASFVFLIFVFIEGKIEKERERERECELSKGEIECEGVKWLKKAKRLKNIIRNNRVGGYGRC